MYQLVCRFHLKFYSHKQSPASRRSRRTARKHSLRDWSTVYRRFGRMRNYRIHKTRRLLSILIDLNY